MENEREVRRKTKKSRKRLIGKRKWKEQK